MTVDALAGDDANPTLTDAIFLDIGLLAAVEFDADAGLEQLFVVERALGIGAEAVGKIGHGEALSVFRDGVIGYSAGAAKRHFQG